jgi:uncharacterized protein (DUF433 family)
LAGGAQIDPRDVLGCPTLSSLVLEGWVLLRFGFSLANLSPGLVRDHRAALHDPFHLINRHIDIRERVAWVLKGTRMPVSVIFENLKAGANTDEIMEWFEGLDREQVEAVIEFAARSLDVTPASTVSR